MKPLELDGVVADAAQIDAAVGEDAVDVEADELNPFRQGGLDHRGDRARVTGRPCSAASLTATPPDPWDAACAGPPAPRARCQTSRAVSRIRGRSDNGNMLGPSDGALSG